MGEAGRRRPAALCDSAPRDAARAAGGRTGWLSGRSGAAWSAAHTACRPGAVPRWPALPRPLRETTRGARRRALRPRPGWQSRSDQVGPFCARRCPGRLSGRRKAATHRRPELVRRPGAAGRRPVATRCGCLRSARPPPATNPVKRRSRTGRPPRPESDRSLADLARTPTFRSAQIDREHLAPARCQQRGHAVPHSGVGVQPMHQQHRQASCAAGPVSGASTTSPACTATGAGAITFPNRRRPDQRQMSGVPRCRRSHMDSAVRAVQQYSRTVC